MNVRKRPTGLHVAKTADHVYRGANALASAKQKLGIDHHWPLGLIVIIVALSVIGVLAAAAIEFAFWIAVFSH
jgi:hypothetical protein